MSDRKVTTSYRGESIQDGLWVDMKRFTAGSGDDVLWRIAFKDGPGVGGKRIEVDATPRGLINLRRFIDKAIEDQRTDGGRTTEDQIRACAEAEADRG